MCNTQLCIGSILILVTMGGIVWLSVIDTGLKNQYIADFSTADARVTAVTRGDYPCNQVQCEDMCMVASVTAPIGTSLVNANEVGDCTVGQVCCQPHGSSCSVMNPRRTCHVNAFTCYKPSIVVRCELEGIKRQRPQTPIVHLPAPPGHLVVAVKDLDGVVGG